ncbi:hypothetical protein U1Q18_007378 [Sarracenia purpurea var. burkii]
MNHPKVGSMFLSSFLTLDRRARFCLDMASRSVAVVMMAAEEVVAVVVCSRRLFIIATERDATTKGGSGRRIKERERETALGAAAVAIVHDRAISTAPWPLVSNPCLHIG